MKTQVLRTSILALLVAVAGHAQSSLPLKADIPFKFIVSGATLPAGQYTLIEASSGLITMNSQKHKAGAFATAVAVECSGNKSGSRLIFHRYEATYLLSEIWTKGNECGRRVPDSTRERELAAKYRVPDETVVVAVR